MKHGIVLFAAALSPVLSVAQPYDVAIAAAWGSNGNPNDCRLIDVKTKLLASGLFSSVSAVDVLQSTPSLPTLLAFDAVITWSNAEYYAPAALGDVLADYVDAGGAVVVGVFASAFDAPCCKIAGRWAPDYEVIPVTGMFAQGSASLGALLFPAHPILAGVQTFEGGLASYRPGPTGVRPGGVRIAEWSDGKTLIAVGSNPARIDLGFYPPSSACGENFWQEGTDGGKILANSLAYAASHGSGGGGCYPDCDLDGILSIDDFICFQTYFAIGDPSADCDGDSTLNIDDFICYQTYFAIGC
jgi:hypothetical protein